jgi:hypothetical protein
MSALQYVHKINQKEAAEVLEEAGADGHAPLHSPRRSYIPNMDDSTKKAIGL